MRQFRRSALSVICFARGEVEDGRARRLIARSRMLVFAPARINRSLSSVDNVAATSGMSEGVLEAAEKIPSMCAGPGGIIADARVLSPVRGAMRRQAMR